MSFANLVKTHSMPSSRSLIKIVNRTSPSIYPWETPLMTSCQLDFTPREPDTILTVTVIDVHLQKNKLQKYFISY